jgi:DNA replication protein DnaC
MTPFCISGRAPQGLDPLITACPEHAKELSAEWRQKARDWRNERGQSLAEVVLVSAGANPETVGVVSRLFRQRLEWNSEMRRDRARQYTQEVREWARARRTRDGASKTIGLWGPEGTGKSVAAYLFAYVALHERPELTIEAFRDNDQYERWLALRGADPQAAETDREGLMKRDILLIDDLGKKPTQARLQQLLDLYEANAARRGLWISTSNYTPERFEAREREVSDDDSAPLASRLTAKSSTVIVLGGGDRRKGG